MPPQRAKRICNQPGCGALTSYPERYCIKHAATAKKRQNEIHNADPVRQLYWSPRWRKFREWFLRKNPQCMRVIDGVQCRFWATVVHHTRGLRSHPEDLIDARFVAAVCSEHHHNEDGDRPGDVYVIADTRLTFE
jgi:hypothetical protein